MEAALTTPAAITSSTQTGRWRQSLRQVENDVVVVSLAAMVLLPLIEAILRRLFNTGIASSASLVQHLCLVLGMMGGAIAARDERLLSLSTLSHFLKGRAKSTSQIFSHAFAAAITMALCIAAWQFMQQERIAGNLLAHGIKRWVAEAVMPLGFGLIAVRLLWGSSPRWEGRAIALMIAAAILAIGMWSPVSHAKLTWPAMALLLAATLLGAPVFVLLGGAAVILFWGQSQPLAVLPIDHYGLAVNATLPTIPLFTLAGYFLAHGGSSERLIRCCNTLVGHLPGGAAIGTALACAFFTSFTGASGVTILALGGLLMPVLLASRYSERSALGLLTGAGSLGLLFPPCLPLILYAIVAHVRIEEMFLAGIIPGVVMVALVAALGIWQGPKERTGKQFRWSEARVAAWEAKWELLLPVVALVSLFGGFATPLEASALTAFYAFAIETLVYRDLKIFRDVPRLMTECGLLVGGVLLILGVALGLTDFLVEAEMPDRLLAWVQDSIHNRVVFLLVLNVFLLIVGCLMDIYSAIIIVVPLIVPLGLVFGINPLHLGIIFLANLELGYLTPPVGMNLFLSSYRFNKPMGEVIRAVIPMLAVLFVGVLLITYLPLLTTFLPGLFGK
jgi:tripartite ATP-independent transporter DctM subunit